MLCSSESRWTNSKNDPMNTRTHVLATLWFALPHWTEGGKLTQVQFSPWGEMNYWVWWWCKSELCGIFEDQVDFFFKSRTNMTDHGTQVCLMQLWQQKSCCSLLPFSVKPRPPWASSAIQGTRHCVAVYGPSFSRGFGTSRASVATALCPTRRQHSLHPNMSTRHSWQLCTRERGTRTTQTLHMQFFSPSSSSPSESPNTSSSYLKISLWT